MTLHVRSTVLDDDRPLLDLAPDRDDVVAWVRDGDGFVGWGRARNVDPGTGTGRFTRAADEVTAALAGADVDDAVGRAGSRGVAIASFTFDPDTAGSTIVVPRTLVARRDGVTWCTTVDPDGSPPVPGPGTDPRPRPRHDRPRYAGASIPDLRWLEAVALAVEMIDAGRLDKVVLARDHALWSREVFDPVDVARRLTTTFPSCHTFIADGLVGATPELLVARHADTVTSRVLAGTAARSDDPVLDERLGRALLDSDKDRWEHQLAVTSVREVLDARCDEPTEATGPGLLRLDNVQHLATDVAGRASGRPHVLELAGDLHPTAAVGGTPRDVALQVIAELEGMGRHRYAAPVGWFDHSGDGEFGIALRCAHLEGARARLFAGVGVVGASLPEDELEETRLKLLAMQRVLSPLD
ncbi:MAG: isochorismate synthase [Nitriliruptoraceae bacterium]